MIINLFNPYLRTSASSRRGINQPEGLVTISRDESSCLYQELHRQVDWGRVTDRFFHFRDRDGVDVDIVVERGPLELAGIEVKASATVTPADFKGLRKLKDATGQRFKAGVVLYDGEACAGFGDGMYAVPIRMLWEDS